MRRESGSQRIRGRRAERREDLLEAAGAADGAGVAGHPGIALVPRGLFRVLPGGGGAVARGLPIVAMGVGNTALLRAHPDLAFQRSAFGQRRGFGRLTRRHAGRDAEQALVVGRDGAPDFLGLGGRHDCRVHRKKGGEQDRSSILLQLVAVARGAPQNLTKGSEWKFFVVGRKSAETWTFRVIGRETVKTAQRDVSAVHLMRLQPDGLREQQLDVWLAPALDWFPAQVIFHDADGTRSEQVLQRIEKK